MAYYRRRAGGRRVVRRRRRMVGTLLRKRYRRRTIPRGPGPNRAGIHYFSRTVSPVDEQAGSNLTFTNSGITASTAGSLITLSVGGGAGVLSYAAFGWQFTLANLPGTTDFGNLFDQYQIRKIVIKLIPFSTDAATSVAGAPNVNPAVSGFMHYAIDKDDVTHPAASDAGVDTLRQRPNYKCRRVVGDRGWSIVIKPRYAQEAFRTAITTAYTQGSRTSWLDIAYNDIPHYGLIGVFEAIQPNAGASVIYLRAEATYYFKCKGVR